MGDTDSAAVVLAAGTSSRLGRTKQLLPMGDGRALLQAVVDAACASSVGRVLVVLGHHADEVRAAVDMGRAEVMLNPAYAEGMSSSLRTGVAAAVTGGARRIVLLLGDQPSVGAGLIDRLLEVHAASGRVAAAVSVAGVLQAPAVVDASLAAEVAGLHGDTGLREVLRARPDEVAPLPLDIAPADVDTADDYDRLLGRR